MFNGKIHYKYSYIPSGNDWQFVIENDHGHKEFPPGKMVIFHSYVAVDQRITTIGLLGLLYHYKLLNKLQEF